MNTDDAVIKGGHRGVSTPLKLILLFTLFALIFWYIQSSVPWLVGYDGYFHIRLSELLREEGFIERLPYLEFTIYRDYFRDHHLLFHYLLVPFTFGDMIHNGKIAVVVFAATAGTVLYLVFNRLGVRYPALWALVAMLSSHAFLYRLSLLRVQSIALTSLIAGFFILTEGRRKLLYLLSMAFVWLYDGFPLLLVMAVVFGVSRWLTGEGPDIIAPLVCLAGILTGLVVNPYFPEDIYSFLYNMSRTIFFDVPEVALGVEWSPYNTWELIRNSLPAFVLLGLTLLCLPFIRPLSAEEYASMVLNLLFLLLTFKSRRFIEYWPVFATLTASLIIGRRMSGRAMIAGMLILMPLLVLNIKDAVSEVRSSVNPATYKGAALWLREHSSRGDVVFNADWDDFPLLFFYNTKNHYIVGLDPMYMYTYDRDKYRLYRAITEGRVVNPGRVIGREFRARFIFLDRVHPGLYSALEHDPWVRKVYEDSGSIVFEVVKEHGVE